jgi:hypothetical protein
MGHAVHDKKYKILARKPERRRPLGDLGIHWRITVKYISSGS